MEYLVKYKGCHHKEVVWMKLVHLDHLSDMVAKCEQERGHALGMKKIQKKKKNPPKEAYVLMRASTLLKVGSKAPTNKQNKSTLWI